MSTPAIRYLPRYTIVDYQQWEGDWELWDGVAICMSPSPTYDHQSASTRLVTLITNSLERNNRCRCKVVAELDWRVSNTTVVRPDVSVLCEGHPGEFISYSPTLIAEVLSPATEHKDRTAKRSLYEQQGVHFYLMLDPQKKSVELLELTDAGYVEQRGDGNTISLELDDNCIVSLERDRIFAS